MNEQRGYVAQHQSTGEIVWHGVYASDEEAVEAAQIALAGLNNYVVYYTRPVKQAVVHEYVPVMVQEEQLVLWRSNGSADQVAAYEVDLDGQVYGVENTDPRKGLKEMQKLMREHRPERVCLNVVYDSGDSEELLLVRKKTDGSYQEFTSEAGNIRWRHLISQVIEIEKKMETMVEEYKGGLING
nr:MAG: hypothetical protein [Microvirus sp.]